MENDKNVGQAGNAASTNTMKVSCKIMDIQHATVSGITRYRVYDKTGELRGTFDSIVDATIFAHSLWMFGGVLLAKKRINEKLQGMALNELEYIQLTINRALQAELGCCGQKFNFQHETNN